LQCLIIKIKNILFRCSRSAFAAAQVMFKDDSPMSVVTTIKAPANHTKRIRKQGLPSSIKLRLVKVILSTGETEVLVTSLIDEEKFPPEIFAELYHYRWGIETFFSKLKGRLGLENFTGKSVEAIRQDFWSTILISNLETIMTVDIEEEITHEIDEARPNKAINRAVSFNVIKNLAFEILSTQVNQDILEHKLKKLFLTNMISIRKDRVVPRHKISDTRSLNFQKRFRKHVF